LQKHLELMKKENTYNDHEIYIKANKAERKAIANGMRFNKQLYINYLKAQL
jgi:hypothetical protein